MENNKLEQNTINNKSIPKNLLKHNPNGKSKQ